ncbi:MAG: transglycosylase SLT domain-containing protein [Vicinamibacteria bacterium]|nr:transglycosylase SLT domain-containing protein [Vicinamibacteria bacterium]
MTSPRRPPGARSDSRRRRVSVPTLVLLALGAVHGRAQTAEGDRLEGLRPVQTRAEAALVEASNDLRSGVQASVVERLRRLSNENAGEEVSGLAQLLVAKASLTLGRFEDAAAAARHPDIDRTGLGDRAFLILARAKARTGDYGASASAYLRAVDAAQSDDVACSARLGAAAALQQLRQSARRVALLTEATAVCRQDHADVLLDLAEALLAQGSRDEALARLEEIERVYPTSPQAQNAAAHIASLLLPSGEHPLRSARQDFERRLARAKALLDGGQRGAALVELRRLRLHKAIGQSADEVQVTLARALSRTSTREARLALANVAETSAQNGEARLLLARMTPEGERAARLNEVAAQFPGTAVAEEALYSLATFFQKDALLAEAAPYYRRLVDEFPDGSYAEGAAMRAAFESLRAGRAAEAAAPLETMARRAKSPAGFLYWAGMARVRNGETERGAVLLGETAERFRNTWYGSLAAGELARLPSPAAASAARVSGVASGWRSEELPGPLKARLRQLLLVGFNAEAIDEVKALGNVSAALEARALIEADRGELRNAIVYMKRARPEFISAEIKDLPAHVWTTIYPLKHGETLRAASLKENLDPALVAALVCQESTFDERARSAVGARGLMQIMPYTGKPLARELGVRYTPKILNEPQTSLTFGTRYFRQMMERFDSRPEAALAAYNAGPHRVDRWLAPNPQIRSDEFAESIPFSETRAYVMIILGARDQYRKLYGLEPAPRPGP